MKDSFEELVRDLSAQLAGMATAFGERVQQISGNEDANPDAAPGDAPDPRAMQAMCRAMREQRKRRLSYFPAEIFHEPSWDMLLMLYIARVDDRVLYVKTLVLAADAPITTSQRWIDHLAKLKLVVRTEDPADRRRIHVMLSDAGCAAMEKYLSSALTPPR